MLELATWARPFAQDLASALDGLPAWAAALILAAPVLLALPARSGAAAVAAAVLALAGLGLLAAGPLLTLAGLGAALALVGALAAAAAGLRERGRRTREAELDERLDHLHRQMTVFLDALDRRQSELDRMREEARAMAKSLRKLAAAPAAPSPPPPQP